MRGIRPVACAILLTLSTVLPRGSVAGQRGFFAGSAHGELRANTSATAPLVATVESGVPFSFEPDAEHEWARVTLDAGQSGWLPLGSIRLFFDESALPREDPAGLSEIARAARARGFSYVQVTRRAARGEVKALRQLFALAADADGAAAESITSIPTAVYHLVGDVAFARFVGGESVAFRAVVRNVVLRDGRLPPTTLYLQRHFPETTKVLFPNEVVAWPSPDGRYVIRKVFSDAFDLTGGKIVRAELVEKNTRRLLLDLTADDIGTGAEREGAILWSPDSKRFASLSIDLTEQGNLFSTPRPRPLRKRTAVYQRAGESWSRVALPLDEVPGRASDTELDGAVLGHDYVEPVRWRAANVLVLARHEYYEKVQPLVVGGETFQSIVGLSRWYSITATIDPGGASKLLWKRRAQ